MAMFAETAQNVNAFFESYRRTFERLNASNIADYFAYPSHITSDGGSGIVLTSVLTKRESTRQIKKLLAMYRKIGVSSAHILNITTMTISKRLVQAYVWWSMLNHAGRSLYDFEAAYTLANINGSLHITAISHNEIAKSQAYLKGGQTRGGAQSSTRCPID
jgi:hypothetical protein